MDVQHQRKLWNQQQQMLRSALLHLDEPQKAIDLFLSQHMMVLQPGEFKQKVEPARLQQVRAEGAVGRTRPG